MSPRKTASKAQPVNALSDIAMLVSLNIRMWAATLTDPKVSAEIAKKHNVDATRAGKYRKNAIDITSAEYKAVVSAKSALRNRYYELTLPWGKDNSRMLSSAMHPKFVDEMRGLKAAYDSAVSDFVDAYPRLREEARQALNGMFNENDYPEHIRSKFNCKWDFDGVPNAEDFRIKLASDVVEEIKADMEKRQQETLQEAMREPYERLYKHINRMVDRLADREPPKGARSKKAKAKAADKGGKFRETLITGLQDLIELIPLLNLTNDERLEDLKNRAAKLIQNVDVKTLRDVPAKRREVHTEAKKIQDIMSAFMGPPQVEDEDEE